MEEEDRDYLMRKTGMSAFGSRFKLKPLEESKPQTADFEYIER